jgi:2-C-methyl-D-erythritol 2,4-cyclodiphosphate synthase
MSADLSGLRIGTGVDVHPIDPSRPLCLAGLIWPEEPGLAGHSDGDVACHAACDALLTAAGLGDLGAIFGTSDPQWAGASGLGLLGETAQRVRAAGFQIVNVAVQVVGEHPRVSKRRSEAEAAMSEAVAAPVTLGATTTDGLGFVGRGDGIAAVANALLVLT